MKRWFYAGVVAVLTAVLFGCGGGGGGGAAAPPVATGTFVDAPVAGLGFDDGAGHRGVTDADGKFTYQVGQVVKFFVGDLVLGEAEGADTVTPYALATDNGGVAIAQFLQSIGGGSAADKLTIPANAADKLKGRSINFATATDAQLTALVQAVNSSAILVSADDAKKHLEQNIAGFGFTTAMLAGKTVTLRGDDVIATYTISADGTLTFKADSTKNGTKTGNGTWVINNSGQLVMTLQTAESYPSVFQVVGGSGNNLMVRYAHNLTPTEWEGGSRVNFVITGGGTSTDGGTSPVTTGFTAVMLSGKTFNFSDTGGANGPITFNADGTTSGRVGTWSINGNGQLVVHIISSGNTATFTLKSSTSTTITASETVSNGDRYDVVTFTLTN